MKITFIKGAGWRQRRTEAVLQRKVEQPRGRRHGRGRRNPGDGVPVAYYVPGVLRHHRGARVHCPAVCHHRGLPQDGSQAVVGGDPGPGGPYQGRQDPEEQEEGPAHDAHRGGGVLAVLGSMAGLSLILLYSQTPVSRQSTNCTDLDF